MANENEQQPEQTFSEAILGKGFFEEAWVKKYFGWFLAWPADRRLVALVALFAGVLFVPFLGAVGLWDPWETHYGEVARMMIHRNDYVHPYWENAWFFSKTPFTMWLQALGMQLVGTNRVGPIYEGPVALLTEWGFRLPSTLFSIAAVATLAYALARTVGRFAAYAAAFVLCTMPLYFILARQAVTDPPVVSANIIAISCAVVALFDSRTKHRTAWWLAFYIFMGIGVLAKGMLGLFPGVVLALSYLLTPMPWDRKSLSEHVDWFFKHLLVPTGAAVGAAAATAAFLMGVWWRDFGDGGKAKAALPALLAFAGAFWVVHRLTDAMRRQDTSPVPTLWAQMYRMKLCTGILLFLAVVMPWFQRMFTFEGVDDEGKLFWYRFLVHDHFARLGSGVHTTTPGGTFTYFIEQGGYAIFPWVVLVPGAIAVAARLKLRSGDPVDQVGVLATTWLGFTFALIGASATKFHHYVFPMLPPLAILIGLFIDRLWTEGIPRHGVSLLMGLPLLLLVGKDLANNPKNFTDLFVYNYDRPYPWTEVSQRPLQLFSGRPLWTGDLVAVLLLAVGGFVLFDTFSSKSKQTLRPIYWRALGIGLSAAGLALLAVMANRGQSISATLFLGLALALAALYLFYEGSRPQLGDRGTVYTAAAAVGLFALVLVVRGARAPVADDKLLRELLQPVILRSGNPGTTGALGFAFLVGGGLAALAALMRSRTLAFGTFWAFVTCFALWFSWSHWVDLSHHWTQRDLFWRYYKHRQAGEPITAFLMNWRGETFYSRNTVKQIKDNGILYQYAQQPGREWALVEHHRLGILKSAVGADKTVTLVDRDINNKFVLVSID